MIRRPSADLTIDSRTVARAANFIDRTGAVELLTQWEHDDRHSRMQSGQQHRNRQGRGPYPYRALLVGMYLLVVTRQPLSWTSLLQMFWFQLSRPDLKLLGLDRIVTKARQKHLLEWIRDPQPRNAIAAAAYTSEYQRLHKSLQAMFRLIRWSPHSRRRKQTNKELRAAESKQSATTRLRRGEVRRRGALLLNRIVHGSIDRSLLSDHHGHILFDEVVVQTSKAAGGTGTAPDRMHAGNPDADWWCKGAMDLPRWALGFTLLMTASLPGETPIPTLVIGISMGKPTGGSLADALEAIDQAIDAGLLPHAATKRTRRKPGPRPLAVADRGFTYKNGLNEALNAREFNLVQDFQANVNLRHVLEEGVVMMNGVPICPGFEPETRSPFQPLPENPTDETKRRHLQREQRLLAGQMPTNTRPRQAVRAKRGRPRKDDKPIDAMRLEVVCPASVLQCRCPLVPDSMQLPPADHPTVPEPPNPSRLPQVCTHTFTSVLIPSDIFKQSMPYLYGSRRHTRIYGSLRSRNEQWHSQLRADHTGGIDQTFFTQRGGIEIGLLVALAVAETNRRRIEAFMMRDAA